MGKMFDTYQTPGVVRDAAKIKAAGYSAVGLYLFVHSAFKEPVTAADVKAISDAGLYILSVYENGSPTSGDYFSAAKGQYDAQAALHEAKALGQPAGTPIYPTVDYDASENDLAGITAYFRAFRALVIAAGYKVGCYGSGLVLQHLINQGLIEYAWLTQSRGFTGYQAFLPKADIVQGPSGTLYGMDIDPDKTDGHAGGWQVS